MMLKIFAILIFALVITITILILIIKQKNKNINSLKSENESSKNTYKELNNSYEKLNKEIKIEKKHNQELAKKLADISCMSIDDVLAELQDNDGSRKNNL